MPAGFAGILQNPASPAAPADVPATAPLRWPQVLPDPFFSGFLQILLDLIPGSLALFQRPADGL